MKRSLENNFQQMTVRPPHRGSGRALLLLSLIMGLIGGMIGTIIVESLPPETQKSLGIKGLTQKVQELTSTEKVTVEESSAVIDVAKEVSPAVVSIIFTKDVEVLPFGFEFFGDIQQKIEQKGGGSGFIITSDGLIVTNKHVVADARADYTVFTSDGRSFKAEILAKDPIADLAIVKIEASGLSIVELGDSDALEIGQRIVAIGNALGEFQNTVTVGVVSAKGRSLVASDLAAGTTEALEDLIQTDAAINTGNSGGPLVNLKGQVVGINTATAAKGTAEGIGFAIPINIAKQAIKSFQKSGHIQRPFLGVNTLMLTKELAERNNLSVSQGALVVSDPERGIAGVLKGSPADRAGIKVNDIIVKIQGEQITENKSIVSILRKYQPGDEIELEVLRDNETLHLKAKLAERPTK